MSYRRSPTRRGCGIGRWMRCGRIFSAGINKRGQVLRWAETGSSWLIDLSTALYTPPGAARWHVHQRRKGAAKEPYVNHLLEVATLVAEATDGKDLELVIAALLHDSIEDQEVPPFVIAKAFGDEVAKVVEEVTDDKKLEKQERKRLQVEHAPQKSQR